MPPRSASKVPVGAETTRPRSNAAAGASVLVATDLEGVYRNAKGEAVDARGVRVDFLKLKQLDEDRWREASPTGELPTTPAELLRAAAFDPRNSLDVRLKAANQAAPYFDMKMPLRVEGELEHKGMVVDPARLAAMSKEERESLLKLLKKLGVTL